MRIQTIHVCHGDVKCRLPSLVFPCCGWYNWKCRVRSDLKYFSRMKTRSWELLSSLLIQKSCKKKYLTICQLWKLSWKSFDDFYTIKIDQEWSVMQIMNFIDIIFYHLFSNRTQKSSSEFVELFFQNTQIKPNVSQVFLELIPFAFVNI